MDVGFTSTLCLVSVLSPGVLDQSCRLAVTGPYPNAHELIGPMPNGSGQDPDQGPMSWTRWLMDHMSASQVTKRVSVDGRCGHLCMSHKFVSQGIVSISLGRVT